MIHRLISDYKAPAGTAITFWGFNFMTNFNETKFFCSRLLSVMSEINGKSPYDHWKDACDLLAEEEAKYDNIPVHKREQKPAIAKLEKIEKVKLKVAELELTKDDDVLSERCKNMLLDVYAWEKYKKWAAPELPSTPSVLNKGMLVEGLSIDMINRLDGTNYSKNEEKFSNDYLIGCPDIVDNEKGLIVDVKSSWNIESFMHNVNKELDKEYWRQVQGYMALLNFNKAEVDFCLITTPEHIIQSEIEKRENHRYSAEEIRANLTFDDIPEDERRLRFVVERDDEAIEKLYKRIRKCREYLSVIEELHLSMK